MPKSLSPSVHSKNSTIATNSGRTHTHFFIFSASRISPLARPVAGRFANVHSSVISSFQVFVKHPASSWHKSVSHSCDVDQILLTEIANDNSVQSVWPRRESAADKFLAAIDAQFGPGASTFSSAVFALCDNAFQLILAHGSDHVITRSVELFGDSNPRCAKFQACQKPPAHAEEGSSDRIRSRSKDRNHRSGF
jgi:hypothetical protein